MKDLDEERLSPLGPPNKDIWAYNGRLLRRAPGNGEQRIRGEIPLPRGQSSFTRRAGPSAQMRIPDGTLLTKGRLEHA